MIANSSPNRMDTDVGSSPKKLVECRICHDGDEDSNMEIPCSCSGSLKYVRCKCVQRWCNEKGDTICEICCQHFKPGYSIPSPPPSYDSLAINLRQWEITGDLPNSEFMGMVSSNHYFLDPNFDDYSEHSSRRLICCCIVAIIFTVLLMLRHTIPIIISCAGEYSATLFMLLASRIIGILLPICIMVKAFTAVQHRRCQQDSSYTRHATFAEENELPMRHPQLQLIHGGQLLRLINGTKFRLKSQ